MVMMADEKPWCARARRQPAGTVCTPRPRERLWTLVKGAKQVDAELLYHGEHGVEVQFTHEGVMAYGQRCVLRAQAVELAEGHRQRLIREGWTEPRKRARCGSGWSLRPSLMS
jgi:hypothetical protein